MPLPCRLSGCTDLQQRDRLAGLLLQHVGVHQAQIYQRRRLLEQEVYSATDPGQKRALLNFIEEKPNTLQGMDWFLRDLDDFGDVFNAGIRVSPLALLFAYLYRRVGAEDRELLLSICPAMAALVGESQTPQGDTAWEPDTAFEEAYHNANDMVSEAFVDSVRSRSRAVLRLVVPRLSQKGTGFLVGPGVVLTNRHVVPDLFAAQGAQLFFQGGADGGQPGGAVGSWESMDRLEIQDGSIRAFCAGSADHPFHDFALIALAEPGGLGDIAPIPLREGVAQREERICVVHHPGGDSDRFYSWGIVQSLVAGQLQYLNHTEPGSSGAPVLANPESAAVGIHTWGYGQGARGGRVNRNAAVPAGTVLDALRSGISCERGAAPSLLELITTTP